MAQLEFEDLAPLARLTRAGLNESFHLGVAALVDKTGKLIDSLGNASKPIYPRSAIKPIQAFAMRELGLELFGEELVITMASHAGTNKHTQLVNKVLSRAGLTESDLLCPLAFPGNPEARSQVSEKTRAQMNCSGKHAGFLATARLNGWSTDDYLELEHPLQQRILAELELWAGERVSVSTQDGCGAPLFAISTLGLAKAMAAFAQADRVLMQTAKAHPWVIGDHGSLDAIFLEHGIMAKIGAEGVFIAITDSGHSVAVKIADGSLRAAPAVAAKLLVNKKLISESVFQDIFEKTAPKIMGGDIETGKLVFDF
jgi:L-asparaginase II